MTIAPDGYSQNPTQTSVDALDSHYVYVMQRILAQFPAQPIGGIVEARDWPFQEAVDQALYFLTGVPEKTSRAVNSRQSAMVTYSARWVWMDIGSNLQQGQQASNRGDKYRTTATVRSVISYGLYPGFCTKNQYNIQDNGSGVAQLVTTTPWTGIENVWWSKPDFATRQDQVTGIIFGYAAVAVSAFEPEINS